MKKILKKYSKFSGGVYYPKIEDKRQYNNINKKKIVFSNKESIIVYPDGYIYTYEDTIEKVLDVVSQQPIKYVDAFFLNGYICDITELYKYVNKQLQDGKSMGEIIDYYRNYIVYDDILKILNFYENRKPKKLLKKISINIDNKNSP